MGTIWHHFLEADNLTMQTFLSPCWYYIRSFDGMKLWFLYCKQFLKAVLYETILFMGSCSCTRANFDPYCLHSETQKLRTTDFVITKSTKPTGSAENNVDILVAEGLPGPLWLPKVLTVSRDDFSLGIKPSSAHLFDALNWSGLGRSSQILKHLHIKNCQLYIVHDQISKKHCRTWPIKSINLIHADEFVMASVLHSDESLREACLYQYCSF